MVSVRRSRGKPGKPTRSRAERRAGRRARLAQIRQVWSLTRAHDPQVVAWVAGSALLTLLVVLLIGGVLLGAWLSSVLFGLLLAVLVGLIVFGRRASKAMIGQVEGQPGASAAVVKGMRGGWHVTEGVQFNKQMDFVHRAVGRPGVVLLAEGPPSRTRGLIINEKKRLAKVVGDTPIYEVFVGEGDGEVPLGQLAKHLQKLPRNIKPAQVNAVHNRLSALRAARPPIPQGPMPAGARMPRGRMR